MPELWQKIERVQSGRFSFRRIAQGFVTASAALSLVLASFVFVNQNAISPLYSAAYEEVAGPNESASDNVDVIDVSHPDSPDDLEEL